MKPNDTRLPLPTSVEQKLRTIRRREIALTWIEGLARTATVLLAAMLVAMAVDWIAGWFDPRIRSTVTAVALVVALAAFVFWCLRPVLQRRTLVSTAREIDETLPELEERWSTVTELAQNDDVRDEVRGSEAMIRRVSSEADAASGNINPKAVVSARPAVRAGRWLAWACGLLAVWFVVNFTEAARLVARFWLPGANISLTEVATSPGTAWVPKGEAVTLKASVSGRVPKGPARLVIRRGTASEKEVTMTPRSGAAGAFEHAIDDVTDSFEYRVRSGDGQTPWHQVTAVERPTISAVRLAVTPPPYSQLPKEEKDALPSVVRVLDGSEVEVGFRADQPLDGLQLDLGSGRSARLSAEPDGWYRFRTQATESFSLTATAINTYNLDSKSKPTCRISVYRDLPPNVKVLAPSDDLAVLPGDKVNVSFEASDDIGLAKAEIVIATTKANGETSRQTIPIPLGADAGKKQFHAAVELDPKAMGLKHGDHLSYVVRVTDTKEKQGEGKMAANESDEKNGSEEVAKTAEAGADADSKAKAESQAKADPGSQAKAETAVAEAAADQTEKPPQSPEEAASALVSAGKPNQAAAKPASGAQPPPNEMAKRALDAGQTSECAPRNITVDEWAGTFEGEKRRKLELAIDPVLKKLDALLANAQEKTEGLKPPAASPGGLQQAHAEPLNAAKGDLKESIDVTEDLKARATGTPYAFIGLQLHNIGQAHTVPAQRSLGDVAIAAPQAGANVPPLDKAAFHIDRARAMLADLSKTYETAKREQKIAEAMEKLNKMYQVFLEDTQALLGSKKPPLNSYDRKIAEVDDEFVQKLKALLEEKKKIMEQLAKLLADDPRMLRRYLAMMELQGTSYRDQMTQLAERQKEIRDEVAAWNAAPESEHPSRIEHLQQSLAPRRRDVVADATKLRENMETWLPIDMKTDEPTVKAAFDRAEKIVQLTSEAMGAGDPPAGAQALSELHALRSELPRFSQIRSADRAKTTAYIANRLAEVESLITTESGQMKLTELLGNGDFPKAAEIIQHRLAQETATLGEKLEATASQVAPMSEEIAAKAAALNKIVKDDIVTPQAAAVDQLTDGKVKAAAAQLDAIVPAFASGEATFDELMKLIIAKLDQAPPPGAPGGAPGVDSIMAMLENEMKAAEGLGIPCRPLNIQLMTDWMKPGQGKGQGQGQGQGQGMGRAQAQAAQAQAQKGQSESERLAKEARERAAKALAQARPTDDGKATDDRDGNNRTAGKPDAGRGDDWNKLASRLEKDLLQGRDNTPPEQYRAAIESYFKTISDSTRGTAK